MPEDGPEATRPERPSLAEKLNRLYEAAHGPGSKPPTNKSVAEGVSALGTPISESFIYYLRTGQRDNPTKKHLEGIARYFGIPTGYFFDEDESQQIYEELELVTAMRDADVRQLALRSSQMSPRMRQWLIQTLNALDEAQTPPGTEVPPVEGPDGGVSAPEGPL